ncbi:MAG: hypothetical protein PUF12_02195 [Thermoflexaceae bacterium]|nr:hypothetical protein [Thermoflexaceae bacterium]
MDINIHIRPELPSEYEVVNNVIYTAFSEQHGAEIGKFMTEHFAEERKKDSFIPELSLVAVMEDETMVDKSIWR